MLFVPLAATEVSDPTAMILGGMGAIVAFLSGILSTILLAKLNSLTKDGREKDKEIQQQAVTLAELKGLVPRVHSLENNTLTQKNFDLATNAQNKTLETQTKMLERHDEKLSALVQDVVGHEEQLRTRSRSNMPAVRAPLPRVDSERPPLRTDGASEVLAPYVPPMRKPLKSQQIK